MPFPARNLFLLVVMLFVAACVPADPLDWKISAKTPRHYNVWYHADLLRLTPELQAEYKRAFNLFAAQTGGFDEKNLDVATNPLCQRLHGRSIRYVILEAYQLESNALLHKMSTTMDNMMSNVTRGEAVASDTGNARFEAVRDRHKTSLELMEARLTAIKRRVAELSRTSS